MASKTMALARALTHRTKRSHETSTPTRGTSMRYPTGGINRNLISLPTELISTTNVHALNHPDISSLNTSSGSSINSGNDSDFSSIDRSFLNTPTMSSDNSSMSDASPITPTTEMGEAKDFFTSSSKRPATTAGTRTSATAPSLEAPAIPQRALSHSKKAHVELSRKRSIQRMSPPPNSLSQPTTVRNSADILSGPTSAGHPFRKELAQVNEVAEEFGLTTSLEEEEREMMSRGLMKFGVNDYLDEISELYGGIFEGQLGPLARPWC